MLSNNKMQSKIYTEKQEYDIILFEIGSEKMTDAFVINYINDKLNESEDKNFIRYTFYELRVKNNLSELDIDKFLKINKDYFENNGYDVYFTGAKYTYRNANMTVQPNELLIAVKE